MSMLLLPSFPDCGCDVTRCFNLSPSWLPHHVLELGATLKPFSHRLFWSEYFITGNTEKNMEGLVLMPHGLFDFWMCCLTSPKVRQLNSFGSAIVWTLWCVPEPTQLKLPLVQPRTLCNWIRNVFILLFFRKENWKLSSTNDSRTTPRKSPRRAVFSVFALEEILGCQRQKLSSGWGQGPYLLWLKTCQQEP